MCIKKNKKHFQPCFLSDHQENKNIRQESMLNAFVLICGDHASGLLASYLLCSQG